MKPKSPVQKNNLVVFPYEHTLVYPYRYTWYICIAMIKYTSLQEYQYLLIQRKSIPQTAYAITLTNTRTHTVQMRIQMGGTGGPDPPGKSQVIWVSIGYKQLDPPPPW